jgi:hypothetical protein
VSTPTFWAPALLGIIGTLTATAVAIRMRDERNAAQLALAIQIARQDGRAQMRDLMLDWHRHVELERLTFDDGDDYAHAFADWLANQTGQTIIATDTSGDGLIVAIPDSEKPDA